MATSAKVGYARVSSTEQNLDRQLESFKALGLDKVFEDKVSGKNTDRPGFQQMMDYVREGDEVFVHSMDRLARNLQDLLRVSETLQQKGVSLHFLKEHISLMPNGENSAISKLLLSMMGAVAEFERSLIRERQAEGIALAKERGIYRGRKPIDSEIIETAKKKFAEGVPVTRIARELGVCRSALYKYGVAGTEMKNARI